MEKKNLEIALFRYGIIAPVLNEVAKKQNKYFKKLSETEFYVPHQGNKKYDISTFKTWLRTYRQNGFKALYPHYRFDKGKSKKITKEIEEGIKKVLDEYPIPTYMELYRRLVQQGYFKKTDLSYQTLAKYIRDNEISINPREKIPRKKYEMEHINMLWVGDFLHGPYLREGKKKRQIYLVAIIDDHSRVIVGFNWSFYENCVSLEKAFKEALLTHGKCKRFYCDNGAAFRGAHLQLVCARLGVSLIHSKPYDSPSRGKIERFFRTVRLRFLPFLNLENLTLDEVNSTFYAWLRDSYHRTFHEGIKMQPMDRLMNDLKNTVIHRIGKEELDNFFLRTIQRKVKNDSTVSVNGTLYEVPTKYMGNKVEIRYPSDNNSILHIYEEDKPVCRIKKLDQYENARAPHVSVSFSNILKEVKNV